MTVSRRAVICIGNPLAGDDGAGPAVHALLLRESLPAGVELIDGGTAGFRLLHLLADYREVIIVDAADFGGEPGEICVIDLHEIERSDAAPISLHGFDLGHVLQLAESLETLPEMLKIIAVQIASAEPGEPMTPHVAAVLVELKTMVLRLLERSG